MKKSDLSTVDFLAGERLTVYLSVCDLCYSFTHILDHFYMVTTQKEPSYIACAVIGALVYEFYIAQVLVVTCIAINSFIMVVKQWRIEAGRGDWRLLSIAFGLPAFSAICAGPFEVFGLGGQGVW